MNPLLPAGNANFPTEACTFNTTPLLSFGVPVRNTAFTVARTLDSILAQDCPDFEIVVCDNHSDDETPDICAEYAERDKRVRFVQNEANIGLLNNFKKVFELSVGKYFRWLGGHDWIDPTYASQCVRELEAHPEAIGVTTYQTYVSQDGTEQYAAYVGERLDSDLAYRRFIRMLWFFTADYRFIDPMYSLLRRDALLRTRRNFNVPLQDFVLSAELSLLGPIRHIPQRLAHRRWDLRELNANCPKLRYQDLSPECPGQLNPTITRILRQFGAVLRTVNLPPRQKFRCWLAIMRFICIRQSRIERARFRSTLTPYIPKAIRRAFKSHPLASIETLHSNISS